MSESLMPLGGGSLDLSGGGLFPNQIERATKREMQGLAGRTLVTRTREQVRGILAHEMVQELGALSMEEAAIISACPSRRLASSTSWTPARCPWATRC